MHDWLDGLMFFGDVEKLRASDAEPEGPDPEHAVISDAHWDMVIRDDADKHCRALAKHLAELMPEPCHHSITAYRAGGGGNLVLRYHRLDGPMLVIDFPEVYPPLEYATWVTDNSDGNGYQVPVSDMTDALLLAQHLALLVHQAQNIVVPADAPMH